MPGRKRKPDHLKIVSGTAQPCRMNPDAPAPITDGLDPADWLSERATEIFVQMATILDEMGIGSGSDNAALAMLASRLEEVEICTAVIEDGGRTFVSRAVHDEDGRIVEQQIRGHPIVAQRSEAMRHAQSLLAEFGLTPAARSKVSAAKKNDENPFAALQ